MAISRRQNDTISDIELAQEDKLTKKIKESGEKPKLSQKNIKVEKKRGFFASTLDELKKVEWPGFRYVLNWSMAIIVFTITLSIILGFADYVFTAGISYANCTAPNNDEGKTLQDCNNDFITKITFTN